jgi:3-isopropylmalate/(R)-2-methylmalate dehydratase small subunit
MNHAHHDPVHTGTVAFQVGDDVSTDTIYPGRFMATVLPSETPQFAFADYAEFNSRLKKKEIPAGSIVLAGSNFGCGSSREQAASTLKGHDLVIVARSFARIFLQNAINLGLHVIICPGIEASPGDELEIGPASILNRTTDRRYPLDTLPPARQAIMAAGGLIPYTRRKLLARRSSITG